MEKFCAKDVVNRLDVSIDSLMNKGLYLIAMILTGGSILFEKTRTRIKELIRELIDKDLKNDDDMEKGDTVEQLHQVLSNPGNFREYCKMATPAFQSHRAVMKVLNNQLDKLSTHTLLAMKRKLKGKRTVHRMKISRCGLSLSSLINQVRKASEKMLSKLFEMDKLQEPLAKAMSLVDLTLKLSRGYETTAAAEFFQYSEEIKNTLR